MYIYAKKGKLQYIKFILLDIICILFAFSIAYFIRHNQMPFIFIDYKGLYAQALFLACLTHICTVFLLDAYLDVDKRGYFKEGLMVLKQNVCLMFVFLIYLYMTQQADNFSRSVYVYFYAIDMILMYVVRCIFKNVFPKMFKSFNTPERLYIVSTSRYIEYIVAELKKGIEYEPRGIILLDRDATGEEIGGIPVVAGVNSIYEFIRLAVVDSVFIELPGEDERVQKISRTLIDMGITVHINVEKLPYNIPNKTLHDLGGLTVVSSSMRVTTPAQMLAKRMIDICGALAGLVLTGLAFIFVAPLIYIESPGPIFFKQTRIGRNGRKFTIYKFRSMYMDAEERKKELMSKNKMQGFMFKMDDDPRITKIGKFIRKTSIDELPQFLNVLKGDMSLVGTRPPTLDEYTQYELHHKKRLSMKPGLTGLWQVSGRSNIVDFEEVVQMDAEYISKWSIGLDFKLIFKTVGVLLGDRDAC